MYSYVAEKAKEIEDRLDEMTLEDETNDLQKRRAGKQTATTETTRMKIYTEISYKIPMLLHLKVVQKVLKGRRHLWKNCFQSSRLHAATVVQMNTTFQLKQSYT